MLDKSRRQILLGDLSIVTDILGIAYPRSALRPRDKRIVVQIDRGDGALLAHFAGRTLIEMGSC
jgi:hypothetical protein